MIKPFKQAGFTVIEIMVVVVIISVLIAVMITNFPSLRSRFLLSEVVHQFGQDVRRAQALALASVDYQDASGNFNVVDGYGVYINLDTLGDKKYLIFTDKAPGNQQYDSSDYVVETIDLANSGVKIANIDGVLGNSVSIMMKTKTMETIIHSLAPERSDVRVIFSLVDDSAQTRSVVINTSGLSEVK